MRPLIPSTLDIWDQLEARARFMQLIANWKTGDLPECTVAELLEQSGVKCSLIGDPPKLAGFEVVDEKLYQWFRLKWE